MGSATFALDVSALDVSESDALSSDVSESNTSEQTSLIYIMGRGHSGSTVLDAMLGNATDVVSVGELTSGILRKTEICSCQKPIADCDFWASVKQNVSATGIDWQQDVGNLVSQAHIKSFAKTLLASKKNPWVKDLIHTNDGLVEALKLVSHKHVVVDSSKEFTRALFLAKFTPQSKIIHLIRNPISVLASDFYRIENGTGIRFLRRNLKGKGLTPFLLLLRIVSWIIDNLLGEGVALIAPKRVMRLRYEDMVGNPSEAFKRLEMFAGLDLSSLINDVHMKRALQVGHNIGGNQMRNQGEFVFNDKAVQGVCPRCTGG